MTVNRTENLGSMLSHCWWTLEQSCPVVLSSDSDRSSWMLSHTLNKLKIYLPNKS